MEQRLSLVTLGVADVARARRFYEALGWRTASEPGSPVAFFQVGGQVVALWGRDELTVDPDGHPWEVAHNPGWTLREDGSVELPG